jgi:hypothetical protein
VALTENNELWLFDGTDRGGWRLNCPRIPGTQVILRYDPPSDLLVVAGWDSSKARLAIACCSQAQLFDSHVEFVHIEGVDLRPQAASFRDGVLVVITEKEALAIALPSGAVVGTHTFERKVEAIGERWIVMARPKDHPFVVFWNGQSIKLVELGSIRSDVKLIFDRNGDKAPWVVYRNGGISRLDKTGLFCPINESVERAVASESGHSVWLKATGGAGWLVDLKREHAHRNSEACARNTLEGLGTLRHWTMRVRFTHVGLDPGGMVRLKAAKGYWVGFKSNGKAFQLQGPDQTPSAFLTTDEDLEFVVEFSQYFAPELHANLMIAEWPDGSCAFLDSRGLLHLQSSDRSIPEVTIALAESNSLPVWASDGSIAGPDFFTGERATSPGMVAKIDEYIRRFVAQIR